jgi:hypothetical protein
MGWVTTEWVVPVFTIRSVGSLTYHHSGQQNGVQSILVLLTILKSGQSNGIFLPEPTSPLSRPILQHLDLCLWSGGSSGGPGPLGTFIFPVSFLTTVGTLVLP